MSHHDIPLNFPKLPATGERRFVWNSLEWWEWFRAKRRKPTQAALSAKLHDYDSFVSFHCGRPVEPESFYKSGLKLGDVRQLNERAREIFMSGDYPWITEERFERAVSKASTLHDKTLFAIIDEREVSGHYLIYGSEHICGIGASLSGQVGFDCQDILKLHGIPTVFRIAIPKQIIPNQQIRSFADYVLTYFWEARDEPSPPRLDWSWILKEEIPAGCILDHQHPDLIPDPLKQYVRYSYRDNSPCFI